MASLKVRLMLWSSHWLFYPGKVITAVHTWTNLLKITSICQAMFWISDNLLAKSDTFNEETRHQLTREIYDIHVEKKIIGALVYII